MQPGKASEMKQRLLKLGRAVEHSAAEMRWVVLRKSNARHVGVHGEPGQPHLVFLGILCSPGHSIDGAMLCHPPLQQGLEQRFQHQGGLRRNREVVASGGGSWISRQQLVQIGGAAAPVTNHHHWVIRAGASLNPAPIDQGLQPGKRLDRQAAGRKQQRNGKTPWGHGSMP